MKLIPNRVSSTLVRQALLAKKDSPKFLFAAGVAGVTCSTVLACRATLKLSDVFEQAQSDLETARTLEHRNYSERDRQRDVTIIKVRTAVRIGQLYAPAAVLGSAAIASLTMSHHMLSQRNLALTAAYATLDKAFGEYRERVVDKYGEEEDRRLRFEHETYQDYDEVAKTQFTATRVTPGAQSMYARFFDQLSPEWSEEPEYNLIFLRTWQNYWNDILKARGHVVLNDVYRSLGMEPSTAGAVVGWVVSKGEGDNFIDFGIWDDRQNARDFVNGREGAILLDFNVDGVIYDKIDHLGRNNKLSWQS